MWLFLLFLSVPLIEIALFIQIGGVIGLWPTLGIVILTALVGTALVRSQGAQAMQQLQSSFSELRNPAEPLAHGAMILFSGALLLTPGFFTDIVGLLLLVPGVRTAIYNYAKSRITVQSFEYGAETSRPENPGETVIDGDFEEVKPSKGPSGWTKH